MGDGDSDSDGGVDEAFVLGVIRDERRNRPFVGLNGQIRLFTFFRHVVIRAMRVGELGARHGQLPLDVAAARATLSPRALRD